MASRPPVLLTQASFYGTLAAVRCFGRAGLEVTVADADRGAPALWSRFVTRREVCPPDADAGAFVEWLLAFGRRRPGHVLPPTSDENAWLLSRHRDALGAHFRLDQPGLDAVFALLNKRRLAEHARAVGLETPATWFPETETDVARLAGELSFPVLLKPTTQILSVQHIKGERVMTADALVPAWRAFSQHRYAPALTDFDPTVVHPMVQAYLPAAEEGIESVSGFVDASGDRLVVRGSRKVLQRPRRLGVGVCFEAMPVDAVLVEGLRALCRRVGYHGVFEAEFIRLDGKARLIDFNPRFFGQMGFDIARGVKLPLLTYAAAVGDAALLDGTLAEAERAGQALEWRYAHRLAVEELLRAQRLSGVMPPAELQRWHAWIAEAKGHLADPVLERDDWRPAAMDLAQVVTGVLRHPRAWLRAIALNR
jgi:D-aspartate ligase